MRKRVLMFRESIRDVRNMYLPISLGGIVVVVLVLWLLGVV
jgi:hypothetical protein